MLAVAAKPATAALVLRDWLDSENGMLMGMIKVDIERTVPFLPQQFIANKTGCKYAIITAYHDPSVCTYVCSPRVFRYMLTIL